MVWDATNFIFWVSGRSGGQEYKGMGLRSTGLLYPGRDWFLGFGFFSPPLWLVFFLKRLFEGASLTIHHNNKNGGWSAATRKSLRFVLFFSLFFFRLMFCFTSFFSRLFVFFFFLRFHLSSFWCPLWLGRFMVGNGSPGSKS